MSPDRPHGETPHPLTLGRRFLLAGGLGNVDAGEDVRNLPRAEAGRLGHPLVVTSRPALVAALAAQPPIAPA
ncbi:hypothetical protein AB0D08_36700 [Kitasatospora sp. NPDC048540]|uniref:hypothetical protein n=1 Tax=unclassified Kitasatospora TaxID=2633591 RepID=UPI00053A7FA0|nr:hypothetical protein [Kitasatospora sp. MBT63]